MRKKLLTGVLLLSLFINNANAGAWNFIKRNPIVSGAAVGVVYLASTTHKARHLSYNLPQVESFFNKNPTDFNPIAEYVLKALSKPKNKNDYDRYLRLAEAMGLEDIPPYSPQTQNEVLLLETPIQEENPKISVYENLIQSTANNDIIVDPQGNIIDTSTEFPIERPQSWKDYVLLKQDSTILGDNLDDGYKASDPSWVKPDNVAAHHLIPAKDKVAQAARDILEKYGININDTVNGVYLPNSNNNNGTQGIEHNGRHPQSYAEKVNKLITDAEQSGGKQEVLNKLNDIKNKLQNAPRNSDWRNVL